MLRGAWGKSYGLTEQLEGLVRPHAVFIAVATHQLAQRRVMVDVLGIRTLSGGYISCRHVPVFSTWLGTSCTCISRMGP
jgi:hypothetical protein